MPRAAVRAGGQARQIVSKVVVLSAHRGDPPTGDHFTADITDITEIIITHLNPEGTKLVIEHWTPTNGLRHVERD